MAKAISADTLADPIVRQRFTDIGQDIFPHESQAPSALAALGAFQNAEIEKWWPTIKAAGISAE
jgi:hypothetical protein